MKRSLDFEIMRIIACFFVIFNHTFSMGFSLFLKRTPDELAYWIYLFLAIGCKFAVPLFFAISGALLLPKEEDIKNIYKHRMSKYLIILVVWSLIYYLVTLRGDLQTFSITYFFSELMISRWNLSYWYLDALLAFFISLPILRKMVKKLSDAEWKYLFLVAVLLKGVVPIVEYLLWNGEASFYLSFKPNWMISNILIYPCLGYYLYYRFDYEKNEKYIPHMWVINVFCIYVSCIMTYINMMLTGEHNESGMQKFLENFDLINCMCIYVTVRYFVMKYNINQIVQKVLFSVGRNTFGIYLMHILIIRECTFIKKIYLYLIDTWRMNDMLAVFVYCFLVMLVGWVITVLLKKIPYLKRLV